MREQMSAPTVAAGPHGPLVDWDPDDEDGIEVPASPEPGDREPKMEESIDTAFTPDVVVGDGDLVASGDGWSMEAVRTPGHTSNHTCYALRTAGSPAGLFTGDHIMGWSTTVISPPDGSMAAYFDSLRKVIDRRDPVLYPTHGAPVAEPGPFLDAFLAHRLDREANVLRAVRAGRGRIKDLVAELYADVRVELHKPAARSTLAHLVKLVDEGQVRVASDRGPRLDALYEPA
jgi:glyoxylase-like metal-dependent hydrolase (beta-lactamase superfamily II)